MKKKPTDNEKLSVFERVSIGALILWLLCVLMFLVSVGCTSYKGGKVVDGTNLAIGMTIPGTEWQINALDYVGGIRVAGQDSTRIKVTNEVSESNSYFGVVTTKRHSKMTADIEPLESATAKTSNDE